MWRILTDRVTAKRRAFIRRRLNPTGLRIAEIGALDSPTFPPHQYNVRFLDYTTKEQLARGNPDDWRFDAARLVDVDYPVLSLDYASRIPERFDLVVANHVVEHVPDTIRWLEGLRSILAPTGHVFLSVPDRRYTFDYLRRETTAEDIIRAYRQRQTKPSRDQIFDHLYYARPIKARDAWAGGLRRKLVARRYTKDEARAEADRLSRGPYVSTHCHVYTFDSFLRLFAELRERQFIRFEIVDRQAVARWSNEFRLLLRAT